MLRRYNRNQTFTAGLAILIIAGSVTSLPETNCDAAINQKVSSGSSSSLKGLGETLKAQGNHQIFLSLLEAAGMSGSLSLVGGGPHTVFAPNDDAFAKVSKDSLEALKQDTAKLRAFVFAQIVAGKVMISDMLVPVKGQPSKTSYEVKNLNGSSVSILCNDHSGEHHPRIDGVARIGKGDILFTDGVIHEIDHLLH